MTMTAIASANPDLAETTQEPAWPAAEGLTPLARGASVHLVGIAGAGMSGLARVMLARGLRVSGCDRESSGALETLAALGADVSFEHGEAHVTAATALVVASPAIPPDTADLTAARQLGVPVTKRAVLLGALVDAGTGVMIAGTHGKSTTTAMTAVILAAAGLDPTVFVGADVPEFGGNARHGGRLVVVEADEYDRSFLHGHPAVAVVTSLEHDHPDLYPTLDDVVAAFRSFAERVRPDGVLIAWAGESALRRVAEGSRARLEWYAVAGDPVIPDDVDWSATDVQPYESGSSFEVQHRGSSHGTFHLSLPGRHNVANAIAAIAAAHRLGVPFEIARTALAAFGGIGRRFETVGQIGGITVIDDYAHHPTEIRATIAGARERFGRRRIWVVFQPHTFSRLSALRDGFADALRDADEAVVLPVFGSRETGGALESATQLSELAGARVAQSLESAADLVAREARHLDVILFLGAGDIQLATRRALGGLARREAAKLPSAAQAAGLGGTVLPGGRLAEHTSLRVGGEAGLMVRCAELTDLVGWWRLARSAGVPVLVLGRGSNVVAAGSGFDGLVLVNRCEAWAIEAEAGDHSVVAAESGVTLAALGAALARQGWSGLERAIGIPGSVGAAVVTNAGAHGWSVGDSLVWADVENGDGESRLTGTELAFVYRGSALKGGHDRLVVRAGFALRRDEPAAIAARAADYQRQRRATQPSMPSVGSMFKNPPGDYAGRLIEAAGLKGTRIGGAMISPVHANFFVNTGGATRADIQSLVALTKQTVRDRFGVRLELEIEMLEGNDVA